MSLLQCSPKHIICHVMAVRRPSSQNSAYALGYKQCTCCEEWFHIPEYRCPCCHRQLRTTPRCRAAKDTVEYHKKFNPTTKTIPESKYDDPINFDCIRNQIQEELETKKQNKRDYHNELRRIQKSFSNFWKLVDRDSEEI